MSEMIERVAKAIYEADDPWHSAFPWPNLSEKQAGVDAYRRCARAAIGAMRPSSNAMDVAGCLHLRDFPMDASGCFDAMISNALPPKAGDRE
jgi:hypothetical protein